MECRDLLRMDQATFDVVMRELRATAVPTADSRRRDQRVAYVLPSSIVAVLNPESPGEREAYQVRPFDLSATGIGVLHGQFVYQATPVLALMKNLAGQVERVPGRVAHSHLVKGRVHALGIKFAERLDLTRFLGDTQRTEDDKPSDILRHWTDLVKVSPREVDRILRDVDARAAQCDRAKRRTEERHSFRGNAMLVVFHPDSADARAKFRVIPTDLSSRGVGFLHGVFVHPGTPCQLILSDLRGQSRVLRGAVARCELASGRVHTVGVKFDQAIALDDFRVPTDIRGAA